MIDSNLINDILLDWALKSPNGLLSDSTSDENLEALYESFVKNGLGQEESRMLVDRVSILL
jgi:hypothetical protein